MNPFTPRARFVLFVLLGTGGDVWPALQLACALRDRGDEVEVASYANVEADVRSLGLAFHAVGSREEYLAQVEQPAFWGRMGPHMAMAEGGYVRLAIPRVHALVASLRERRPVLVCTRNAYGARFAAEQFGLQCINLVYSPQQLITPDRLPYPANTRLARALPVFYKRAMLRLADRFNLDLLLPTVNALRLPLGLPPIRRLREWLFFGSPALALYPRWFDDLSALASSSVAQGDFLLRHTDEDAPLDEALLRFLDAGPPPVVCSLGTGIAHARERYALVAAALAQQGRRGVFVTTFDGNLPEQLGEHVFRVAYANLAPVLRRCALLIHHGGIGTMAQAMLAGTPQLVMPFFYDQADNGERVRRLGLGGMLEGDGWDVGTVAAAIEHALSQPAAQRLALRERMRASAGEAACVDAFESLLATVASAPAVASASCTALAEVSP